MRKKFLVLLAAFGLLAYAGLAAVPSVFAYDDYSYDYETTSSIDDSEYSDASAGEIIAFITAYFGLILCISIPFYIYHSVTLMVTAKKLGEDNTWLAFIPIVSAWYQVKISGLSPWLFLLYLIPVVNFVFGIFVAIAIANRRGFDTLIGLLASPLVCLIPGVGAIAYLFGVGYVAWGEPGKKEVTASPVVS